MRNGKFARLYADASMPTSEIRARFGIGESSLYRIIQRQGTPLRGHSAATAAQPAPGPKTHRKRSSSDGRRAAAALDTLVSTAAVAEQASAIAPATRGRSVPRRSVAQPRMPASPVAITQAQASGNGTRFRIRYAGERVFEAQSIQDALRQAESLGATDIMCGRASGSIASEPPSLIADSPQRKRARPTRLGGPGGQGGGACLVPTTWPRCERVPPAVVAVVRNSRKT